MNNFQYHDKVFSKLLGKPTTSSQNLRIWDKTVLNKKKMFGNNIPFDLIMLSGKNPDTISFLMNLKSDYSNSCNIEQIYSGAAYLPKQKSLYLVANDLLTVFVAFRYIIGYNAGKFNIGDATKGFRDEIYNARDMNDTDKVLVMKDNFTAMLSYMNIDSLENYVNLPPYMENDSLNLVMESEANALFYNYLDRKKKTEDMSNRDIFNLVKSNKYNYDTGDRTTSIVRKR